MRKSLICSLLLVLSGWIMAQFIGTPTEVYAAARPTLQSLQDAIDNIISGATIVGASYEALHAEFADDAMTLEGIESSAFAQHGQAILVGSTSESATSSTAGKIRWDGNTQTLQVSDGTAWRPLAYE